MNTAISNPQQEMRARILTEVANETLKSLGLRKVSDEEIRTHLKDIGSLPVRDGLGDTVLPLVLAFIVLSDQPMPNIRVILAHAVEKSYPYKWEILEGIDSFGFFSCNGVDEVVRQAQIHMKDLLYGPSDSKDKREGTTQPLQLNVW